MIRRNRLHMLVAAASFGVAALIPSAVLAGTGYVPPPPPKGPPSNHGPYIPTAGNQPPATAAYYTPSNHAPYVPTGGNYPPGTTWRYTAPPNHGPYIPNAGNQPPMSRPAVYYPPNQGTFTPVRKPASPPAFNPKICPLAARHGNS
jgi:hypothetical protein